MAGINYTDEREYLPKLKCKKTITLKQEFEKFWDSNVGKYGSANERTLVWEWVEDKLVKAKIEGEIGKYDLSVKLARINALDDAIKEVKDSTINNYPNPILIEKLQQLKVKKQ